MTSPYIFDRFFRVKGKATRHITGSGLGLSLVKEVVEAHQGYIDVQSELEKGTPFTLNFPRLMNTSDTSLEMETLDVKP